MKDTTPSTELTYNDLPELVDIVGISFRTAGKVYYFASNGIVCHEGEHAIVETTRGAEYGIVTLANHLVPKKDLVLPLRSIVRVATPEDDARFEQNTRREEEAYTVASQKIAEHKLDMKLVDVEYTFDNSKLLFYFTADDRVDFRDLVKDLASVFRTRIELRQIGIRDEAKMMGGLGICGREFCCHSFLGDFAQVTIKMAKEQNLSLNAAKISGACGKLMCCLRYEHESYQQEIALTPKVDSHVTTPDGPGVVVSSDPLRGICNIHLDKTTDNTTTPYHRDLLNRPENPTSVPSSTAESSLKVEAASKKERSVHHNRPNRPAVEFPEAEPSESINEPTEKADANESPKAEATERKDRHNGRHGGQKGRRDHRKKPDNKGEGNNGGESKSLDKSVDDKHSASAPKSEKHDKGTKPASKEDPGKKQNRQPHVEKKSDSKFDVKFGGGDLPADYKGNESGQSSRAGGDRRHHHRRGGKNEKKNEKKPQKTENNN